MIRFPSERWYKRDMNNMLRFELDLTNVEEADNGSTTYYGGEYVLNGVTHNGYGDDRSDSFHTDIDEAITKVCAEEWPDLEEVALENLQDDLQDARDELWKSSGTIVVMRYIRSGINVRLAMTVEKK